MKKVPQLAVVTLCLFVAGCANQPLNNSFKLTNGMTKSEVLSVMESNPFANEFNGDLEEWHYCDSGSGVHQYVAVFFSKGRVFAMKPYTVIEPEGLMFTSCTEFVKQGNYIEPDAVREYRVRYRRG